ncbi:hypothetical protein Pmar_PMAR014673 [Perkinsus marinus ATCC 50983]|uniref:Uncharacterized protein n=1 Tax=Perkinsus marinus (strain ATCC 50983 / TXsc) TaxID=423536 RepID=C5LIQ1_PERM5|nr:hypothetical protein Pmar_PMAR014673 [Perkinsus marinus ATCC 50983]EER03454.1 hypothetical protein Pmar_PMAR014673 [Perkinsus marinus ATCC 50983]|eukprot:XP_002771638.1 hypothetical protein Pmar_PMAR014673 [Perkinsus marinus ATCC 50983]
MSGRFEDHYKKYTTVEDRKRVQNNRVAGISDFLAWAKDAKEVDVDTATGELQAGRLYYL